MKEKQIVVSFSYVDYTDKRRRIAQETAIRVMGMRPKSSVSVISFDYLNKPEPPILRKCQIHHVPILKKDSSRLINNTRRLPYIKEILNNCNKVECDIIGYVNSDILIPMRAYKTLQKQDFDAYIFSRTDIGEVNDYNFMEGKFKAIYGGDHHCGADGFFFKKSWWDANKDKFPDDLVLGETEWDTCYRIVIKNIGCNYSEERNLYHVYHDAKWQVDSPGGKNNIQIMKELNRLYN